MRTLVAILLVALLAPAARAEDVPPMQQSLLFLRVLAYDRNLRNRAGEALTVAVVHRGTPQGDEVTSALQTIAQKSKVAGLPLKVVSISYDASSFDAKLAASHAAAVYVCPDLGEAAATSVVASTRKHAVVSSTGAEKMVRGGLSIGFVEREGRPALLINLPSTKAEGADLDAAVLRLAEVIR
jgi:hypothetical protein